MATLVELRALALSLKPALEAAGEVFAGVEQALKGDGARVGTVVKEDGDGNAGGEAHQIRARGVDGCVGSIGPWRFIATRLSRCRSYLLERTNALALVRREHGEADAVLRPAASSVAVSAAVSASHMPSGWRAVVALVIGDAPADLRERGRAGWPAA